MFLTREDYEKIERYLKQNAKKDSDFKSSKLIENDCVVVNRDVGNNLRENFLIDLPESLNEFLKSNITFESYSHWKDKDIGKLVPANSIWEAINSNTTNIGIDQLNSALQNKLNNVVTDIKLNDGLPAIFYDKSELEQSIDSEGNKHLNFKLYYAGSDWVGGPARSANEANRVKHSLTIGDKAFNGSDDVAITASDLGIGTVFNYAGISTTNPLTDGATIEGDYSITWTKGTIVHYNGDQYILKADGNIADNWEYLSNVSGYATTAQLNELANNTYSKGTIDAQLENLASRDLVETKYTKPDSGIPVGDLDDQLQESIATALNAANDYNSMIEGGLELTSRKIHEWEDLDTEEEEIPISLMYYPTARLVKNSLDTLYANILTLLEVFGGNLNEFVSKIQKTTPTLTPNKTLAEIDGIADNDTVVFSGILELKTFGDYGTRTVHPREFTNCSLTIDDEEPLEGTVISGGVMQPHVEWSKQFIEGTHMEQHYAVMSITYNGGTYEDTCVINTGLRKFFFFGDLYPNDALPDFIATNLDNGGNSYMLAFGNTESYVEYNSTSDFNKSTSCLVAVPTANNTEGTKYIYMLIPYGMEAMTKITQPEAFGAEFEFTKNPICQITRHVLSKDPSLEDKTFQYNVYRSANAINPRYPKVLKIS